MSTWEEIKMKADCFPIAEFKGAISIAEMYKQQRDEALAKLSKLENEIDDLLFAERKQAIQEAAEIAETVIERTSWGWDGDCGTCVTVPEAILASIPKERRS